MLTNRSNLGAGRPLGLHACTGFPERDYGGRLVPLPRGKGISTYLTKNRRGCGSPHQAGAGAFSVSVPLNPPPPQAARAQLRGRAARSGDAVGPLGVRRRGRLRVGETSFSKRSAPKVCPRCQDRGMGDELVMLMLAAAGGRESFWRGSGEPGGNGPTRQTAGAQAMPTERM